MFLTAALCGVIYALFRASPGFADFFNLHVSPVFRWIFTNLSNIVPFSVTEFVILFSPVIIVYLCMAVVRNAKRRDGSNMRLISSLLAVTLFIFSSFVTVYSPAYFGRTIDEKTGLDVSDIKTEDLVRAMSVITDEINAVCEKSEFPTKSDGATIMPDGFNGTVKKIGASYSALNGEYPFFTRLRTVAKPIILSPLMTYTHISGIYTYYTGEVNINTNYPDYIVTSTIAHEMAHQRGIAKEDEANFSAFLVLVNSEDDYLKYSGYLDVYTTVASAVSESAPEVYKTIRSRLCPEANRELTAYSDFFDKYRENRANDISEALNDAYLQSQGTEGTVSYDLVTRLIAAYYREG